MQTMKVIGNGMSVIRVEKQRLSENLNKAGEQTPMPFNSCTVH